MGPRRPKVHSHRPLESLELITSNKINVDVFSSNSTQPCSKVRAKTYLQLEWLNLAKQATKGSFYSMVCLTDVPLLA